MLVGPTTLTGPVMPGQHIGQVAGMWQAEGKTMPWAMALGVPPTALVAAGMPLPARVSEDGYVGALAGEPVRVVRAETSDLLVPADAEIVVEGYLDLSERVPEGPMGEYHGYLFPGSHPQPVFHVEAVTFRDDPILPVCTAGQPPEENHTIWCTTVSATALDALRAAGLPVDMAWCSYEAAGCWMVVTVDPLLLAARRTTQDQLVADVAAALFGTHAGWYVPKIILVGNDIDPVHLDQVVWAMATRHHPETDHYVFPDAPSLPLAPYLTAAERQATRGGKSISACFFPEQFEGRMDGRTASFATSYPAEIRARVLDRWRAYGFPA